VSGLYNTVEQGAGLYQDKAKAQQAEQAAGQQMNRTRASYAVAPPATQARVPQAVKQRLGLQPGLQQFFRQPAQPRTNVAPQRATAQQQQPQMAPMSNYGIPQNRPLRNVMDKQGSFNKKAFLRGYLAKMAQAASDGDQSGLKLDTGKRPGLQDMETLKGYSPRVVSSMVPTSAAASTPSAAVAPSPTYSQTGQTQMPVTQRILGEKE
jgi:hypothetical protein